MAGRLPFRVRLLTPHPLESTAVEAVVVRPFSQRWPLLRGFFRPLCPYARPLAGGQPAIYIEDELFSLMMIHALLAKRHGLRTIIYAFENIPLPARRLSARFFARWVDVALGANEEALAFCRAAGVRQTRWCPCPVQEPPLERVKVVTQVRRVGFLGRHLAMKGLPEFCAAADRLPNLEFVVYGKPKPETPVIRYGAARQLGFCPDLEEAYGSLDVLVVPSKTTRQWKEQYGRVVAEGMARGLLVLGSDSGGIREVLGRQDLVFREGSGEAIAAAVAGLAAQSPEALAATSRWLRRRFVEELSTDRFLKVLQGVVTAGAEV